MALCKAERTVKELFIGHCWEYLRDNFHKFSDANKIKVALTLVQKDMPTIMEGGLNVTQMPVVKIDGKPLHGDSQTDDSSASSDS